MRLGIRNYFKFRDDKGCKRITYKQNEIKLLEAMEAMSVADLIQNATYRDHKVKIIKDYFLFRLKHQQVF